MNPVRFRVLLVTTLLAVQLGTVAVFVEDARWRAAEALDTQAREALSELADTALERTRDFLATAEAPLQGIAALVAADWLDPGDDAALERQFLAQVRGRPWLRALYLGRPDGSLVAVAREEGAFRVKRVRQRGEGAWATIDRFDRDGRRGEHVERWEGYDPRVRPWYRLAETVPGVGWVDPYVFFTQPIPGVSAALSLPAPESMDGEELGVLGIDIDVRAFSRFVSTLAREEGSSAVLMDASGAVIGASSADWLGRGAEGRLPRLEELADESLAAIATADAERAGRDTPIEIEREGRRLLGVARRLPETGWTLLVKMPVGGDAAALGSYFSTRLRALLGALALLALVATAAVLGMSVPFARIHRDATTDALTGALSRAEFERRLDERLKRQRRRDERLVVVGLDLDGFKAVNDTHGHAAGDEVLVAFVGRLRGRLRRDDLVGRPGGDEFLLALTLPAADDPQAVVESIRRALVAEPVRGRSGLYPIGVTAGVAVREDADTRAALLERADAALVAGKAVAKNRTYSAEAKSGAPGRPTLPSAA